MNKINELISNESGQGMVEYAMIIVFVAVVVIVALASLGKSVIPFYKDKRLLDVFSSNPSI